MEKSLPNCPTPKTAESATKSSVVAGVGAAGLADFFSPEVFQIVLHNPTTAHQLLKFSQSRFCGENMEFLEKVCSSRPVLLRVLGLRLMWLYLQGGPIQHPPG